MGRDPKTLRYGISRGFRNYLEDYLVMYGESDDRAASVKRLLALPKDATPSLEYDRHAADLFSRYEFEHDLEAAERPISERWGDSPRRLSARFMARLEEARFQLTREQRLELRLKAGWGPASDDKIVQLSREGRCVGKKKVELEEEKARIRALALALEYKGDPFDYASDPPARYG